MNRKETEDLPYIPTRLVHSLVDVRDYGAIDSVTHGDIL